MPGNGWPCLALPVPVHTCTQFFCPEIPQLGLCRTHVPIENSAKYRNQVQNFVLVGWSMALYGQLEGTLPYPGSTLDDFFKPNTW